jgi:hypothetical protein
LQVLREDLLEVTSMHVLPGCTSANLQPNVLAFGNESGGYCARVSVGSHANVKQRQMSNAAVLALV